MAFLAVPAVAQQQYIDRDQFFNNIRGVLNDQRLRALEKSARNDAVDGIKGFLPQIDGQLDWTNHAGGLVRVTIQEEPTSGITALVGPPVLLGTGDNPTEILARNFKRGMIATAPRSGFVLSGSKSFYLWVEKRPRIFFGDKWAFGYIHYPFNQTLERDARTLILDEDFLAVQQEGLRLKTTEGVVEHLEKKVRENAKRSALQATYKRVEANQRELDRIKAELRTELIRAEKARAVLITFQRLGALLTLAAATAEVAEQLPDLKLGPVSDKQTIIQSVSNYSQQSESTIITLQTKVTMVTNKRNVDLTNIRQLAIDENAPAEVIMLLK